MTILIPYLIVDGAEAAIALYQELFDAELMGVFKPEGESRILNAMIMIDGQRLMIMDPFPDEDGYMDAPAKHGGVSNTTHVQVDNQARVDEIFTHVDERFRNVLKPGMQFWGDYYGHFIDPFGQSWSVGFSPQTSKN